MRNDTAKLMKSAADVVASRIDAHPSEVLVCMRAEWGKATKGERAQMLAYMKTQASQIQ